MSEEQDPLERIGDGVSLAGVWKENLRNYIPKGRLNHGFMGRWSFFKSDGSHAEAMEKSIRCARTYTVELDGGEDVAALVWRNVHEDRPGLERATQREQDQYWECAFRRDAQDPYFSGHMSMSPMEKEQGLPSCLFWRSILLSPGGRNSCRLPLSLPPDPVDELTDPGTQFSNWNPHVMSTTVWAYESFVQDGAVRWSAGPLYSMHTLRLVTHFFIRERQQDVDIDTAITHEDWQLPPSRPRLAEDPQQWMDGGTWKGIMHEMIWDEDGEILALRPRPAAWHPPPPRPDYRLFRYEDGMYAQYPLRISPADSEATSTFANGLRFEFGGMMRDKQEFRRVILRYSVCGPAESVVVERYHAEEVSHFDGRVRRSMDLRQSPSQRGSREFKDRGQATSAPRSRTSNAGATGRPAILAPINEFSARKPSS